MESTKDQLAQRVSLLKQTALSSLGRLKQEAEMREKLCNLKSPCQFLGLTFNKTLNIRADALLAALGPELTAKFDINTMAYTLPPKEHQIVSDIFSHPYCRGYFYLDLRLPLTSQELVETVELLASLEDIEGVALHRIFLLDYSQFQLASMLPILKNP